MEYERAKTEDFGTSLNVHEFGPIPYNFRSTLSELVEFVDPKKANIILNCNQLNTGRERFDYSFTEEISIDGKTYNIEIHLGPNESVIHKTQEGLKIETESRTKTRIPESHGIS